MGLTPDEFWSLNVREFWIKHAAFGRAENRREAAFVRLALRLGHFKKNDRVAMERHANALVRYPVKKWLLKD